MDKPTCATCAYYEHSDPEGDHVGPAGYCHRNAPVPPTIDCYLDECSGHNLPMVYLWPKVHDMDWCGEHPLMKEWIAYRKASRNQIQTSSPVHNVD